MTTPTNQNSREYGAISTIGVAVPQANPTVEPEMWTLLPPGVNLLTTRLTGSKADSRTRLLDYWDSLQAGLDAYDTARLDAVGFANTGSSYLVGQSEESRRVDAISAKVGYPIITAAQSISAALKHLGAKRVALFAPYPQWLIDAGLVYWKADGIDIVDVKTVDKDTSDTRGVYEISSDDVMRCTSDLQHQDADLVLFTGTGMPTLRSSLAFAERTGKPVISSNICMTWALLRAAGVTLPAPQEPEALFGGWMDNLQRWAR